MQLFFQQKQVAAVAIAVSEVIIVSSLAVGEVALVLCSANENAFVQVENSNSAIKKISESGSNTVVNNKGVAYPEVTDIRTGKNMVFPDDVGPRVPKDSRVGWYRNQSEANLYRVNETDILCKKDYIDEWYRRGYETPEGGWDLYEIHHIKPREFGGSSDFENMVPLLKDIHRKVVTPWWNAYGN